MPNITSALIGKTIVFETYAPTVLGGRYKDAKVLAILDADTAKLFADVLARHIAVYPYIQNMGVLDDHTRYNYLKLLLSTGEVAIFGIPWINDASVVVTETTEIEIKIKGRTHEDVNLIRQALVGVGIDDFTINVIS